MDGLRTKRNAGFTVVEIMIVATIIAILAVIAIPNLLRARLQANEASTIQNLRAILSAQGAHHAANGGYSTTMAGLAEATPPFLDHDFMAEPLNGYEINFGGTENNYTITANPASWGINGLRGFFTDASGVIRYNSGAPADENSPPLH
jgi:type IV pilus assembly protein PilA